MLGNPLLLRSLLSGCCFFLVLWQSWFTTNHLWLQVWLRIRRQSCVWCVIILDVRGGPTIDLSARRWLLLLRETGESWTMICGRWLSELVTRRITKQSLLPDVQLKLAIIGTCVGVTRCTALSLTSVPFVAVLGRRRGNCHHPSWVLQVIHWVQLGLNSSVMVEGCRNFALISGFVRHLHVCYGLGLYLYNSYLDLKL